MNAIFATRAPVKALFGKVRLACAAGLAAVALVGPAEAGVIVAWPNPYAAGARESYSSWTDIHVNGQDGPYAWGGVSIFPNVPGMGGQVFTLCVDLEHGGWSSNYDVTPGMAGAFGATRDHAFDLLITNTMSTFLGLRSAYLTSSTAANAAAINSFSLAIQLAAWEISEETSSTLDLRLGAGAFYLAGPIVYGRDADADQLAIGFIDNITNSVWTATGDYNLFFADSASPSPNAQNLMFFTSGAGPFAVPEPGSLPMVFAGLGVIGFVARRRAAKAVSAA